MPEIPQHQKQTHREKHTALLIMSLSYPMIGTHGRERGKERGKKRDQGLGVKLAVRETLLLSAQPTFTHLLSWKLCLAERLEQTAGVSLVPLLIIRGLLSKQI